MMTRKTRRPSRNSTGSILAETAAGVFPMLMILTIATVIFSIIGFFALYKIKVGFVTNNAARYAAGLYAWNSNVSPPTFCGFPDAQTKVTKYVNAMLIGTGLPQVSSNNIQLNDDGSTLTCSITVTGFVYPFGYNVPYPIIISDTAAADLTAYQPPAILNLYTRSSPNVNMQIPCYGSSSGLTLPSKLTPPKHVFKIGIPGNVM